MAKKKIDKNILTANEFSNVSDIVGNCLYTKDGYIFFYIKIQPISISTMSNTEIKILINSLTTEFASETNPITFLKVGRPVDISPLLESYQDMYKKSSNLKQRELLRNTSAYLHKYATNGSELENQYYIIIYDKFNGSNKSEVERRAFDCKKRFENCKIKADICNYEEIVRLCNLFANPSYSHIEDLDLDETISSLLDEE